MIWTELLIIVGLALVNGLFAMSELAVVSSRRSRLKHEAEDGSRSAAAVLKLIANPQTFLSTVQVGITLIGIAAGFYGGARVANTLEGKLASLPALAPYSAILSYPLVIALITYLSLILGELVPKRLALSRPEGIAKLVALPMQTLSRLFRPVVAFLDWSTERLFILIPFTATDGGGVTEEEIEALLSEGAAAGVIEHEEQQMMHKVLRLADRPASAIMTPRTKVRWLDLDRSDAALLQGIAATPYSFFPVGAGSLDRIAGILSMKDLATHLIASPGKPIRDILRPVVQIPEGISALQVLDRLRSERSEVALVIDEYGSTTGIVSIHDLLEAIVGDLPSLTEPPPTTTLRADGSLLVDGAMDIHELFRLLKLPRSSLSRVQSHSVAGFIMEELKRVARTGDRIEFHRAHLEVVDMDGQRIDKALATPPDSRAPTEET